MGGFGDWGIWGFPDADFYDSSATSLNRNRVPGSRVRSDKNNYRKGKGPCWKGQREVNWEELRDGQGECGNHYSQVEFGNEGVDGYQDKWAVRLAM